MDDYRWFEFENYPIHERYPGFPWLAGAQEWAAGLVSQAFSQPQTARLWLDSIRRAPAKTSPCPRVFVSHRQVDKDTALRVAWLAWGEGLDYWIDLIDLDPAVNRQAQMLQRWLGRPLTPPEKSVILAAIIEMALLNCTHVIAVMTGGTAGSQWVPYEYGRMKDKSLRNTRAACWWDSTTLPNSDLPEYVHLAFVHRREADISDWFRRELRQFHGCNSARRGHWAGATPNALPTG